MAFNPEPVYPGDLFDSGVQISESVEQKLSSPAGEGERARLLEATWATVQELGWTVAAIPEELGGVGGGFDDIAAIAEGLARGGTSLSVADPCLVAPDLLVRARSSARAKAMLKDIAAGSARAACAWSGSRLSSAPDAAGASISQEGGRISLRGAKFGVEACIGATDYLVLASTPGTPLEGALVAVPRTSGLKETIFRRPDGRYCADLRFADVALPADAILLAGIDLLAALEQAVNLGALLSCVSAQSAMAEILAQTITYLSTRKQFSVTLSTFQVLRHRVADMYVAYENARAATQRAIAALHAGPRCARAISLAKINVGEAARFVAQSAIQLHGGMGMTEDLKAARLAKYVLMADFEYGDRHFHQQRACAKLQRDHPRTPH